MTTNRGHWGSKLGFILAAAGSAVGLGNIWKFPYMTGSNGGAAFLIIYLLLTFTIGLSIMLAEFSIGRASERNGVGAFIKLGHPKWKYVGYLGIIAAFLILSFYSVVAGWTIAYIVKTIQGLPTETAQLGSSFEGFITSSIEPVIYHGLFMVLTLAVVLKGISGGIEKASKILMPMLFILLIALIVRSLTLEGAAAGIDFFLKPDFSKVTIGTVGAALGQAFFSLSLGMGTMITYGSYLSRKENLRSSAVWVTSLDSFVAILAGLLIMPAVFAFGFDPASGPGLTFITLPAVFAEMPFGTFFGVLFFFLLAVAALTSAVSILEVLVSYICDEFKKDRLAVTLTTSAAVFISGIVCSLSMGIWGDLKLMLGMNIFDSFSYIAENICLPLGGLFIALYAGWVGFPRLEQELTNNGTIPFALLSVWRNLCRFVIPVAIAWIFYGSAVKPWIEYYGTQEPPAVEAPLNMEDSE